MYLPCISPVSPVYLPCISQVRASYLELYNEQINDLLNPDSTNLQLRAHAQTGVFVENLLQAST